MLSYNSLKQLNIIIFKLIRYLLHFLFDNIGNLYILIRSYENIIFVRFKFDVQYAKI